MINTKSALNYIKDGYSRVIDFAERYLSPYTLELVHVAIPIIAINGANLALGGPQSLRDITLSQTPLIVARAASAVGSMIYLIKFMRQHLTKPYIDQSIINTVNHSKGKNKSVLIIQSTTDHNGALTNFEIKNAFKTLAKDFSIDLIQEYSKNRIQNKMRGSKRYDKIIINGHGNSGLIELSQNCRLTFHSEKTITWLKDHLKQGGTIALWSCKTGKGGFNIARHISYLIPHAKVYAPSTSINCFKGWEIDDDLNLSFNNGCFRKGKDITRIYQNGVLIRDGDA